MALAVRNAAIVALLALLVTVAPAGGNVVEAILVALTITFLAAIAMLGVQTWQRTSFTRDVMTERQRITFCASLGAIALMIAGLDEMFNSGGWTVVWFLVVGTAGYLAYTTWRQANSY
jgi:TRAP-type C4-dicarboxylate transport system permease small subunit